MYPTGRYNVNFDICAILLGIFIVIYYLKNKDLRQLRTRLYLYLVLCLTATSVFEFITLLMRNAGMHRFLFTEEFCLLASHICHNSIEYIFALYLLALADRFYSLGKFRLALLTLPEFLMFFLSVVPPFKNRVYTLEADGTYRHSSLFPVYWVVVGIYTVIILGLMIRYRRILKHKLFYLLFFFLGCVASMVLSILNPYLKATVFLQILCMTAGVLTIENDADMHDPETGLYNRLAFISHTEPRFDDPHTSAVISVRILQYNSYAPMLGDENLRGIIRQISTYIDDTIHSRGQEFVRSYEPDSISAYHTEKDRFALLLRNSDEERAVRLAEMILGRFGLGWKYHDTTVVMSAAAEVAEIPTSIKNAKQLMVFLNHVSETEAPGNVYVSNQLKDETRQEVVRMAIQRALDNRTFDVYYQPIYDTTTNKIHSAEALVRMNDPELGFVSPEEFIKIAEHSGTVSQIDDMVFEKVCRFVHDTDLRKLGIDFIEVNLSTIQCMDETLPERLTACCRKYNVPPSFICLEITESALIYNNQLMKRVMQDLLHAGFFFALDDFGTGYSNYSYLMEFPFSIVKIDKSFLWSAEKSPQNHKILYHMINIVQDLNLHSVVEGVETEKQKNDMVKSHVSYLQGYYYSRPVPQNSFVEYVKTYNKINFAEEG